MYVKDADLTVKETKVTGMATGNCKEKSIEVLKNEAIMNILLKNNADVLVEPIFIVEVIDKNQTITVTGYPATYENIKAIEYKEKKNKINLWNIAVRTGFFFLGFLWR